MKHVEVVHRSSSGDKFGNTEANTVGRSNRRALLKAVEPLLVFAPHPWLALRREPGHKRCAIAAVAGFDGVVCMGPVAHDPAVRDSSRFGASVRSKHREHQSLGLRTTAVLFSALWQVHPAIARTVCRTGH